MATALILTAKISTKILAAPEFFEAWKYLPFLVVSSMFACIANFLTSVYMVEKKSMNTFVTTLIAASINVGLTFALIKDFGCMGVAFANLACYVILFAMRAINTRKYIKIQWNIKYLLINIALIALQCIIMLSEVKGFYIYSAIITALIVAINFKELFGAVADKFIKKRNKENSER